MTRTFWTPLVLILTSAVLALPAAAQSTPREQERQKAQCERNASECLGRCADKYRPAPNDAAYNACVPACNEARNNCLLFNIRR